MCNHEEKIEVSGLVYCKKCNKYLHPIVDDDFAEFVSKLNEQEKRCIK